MRACRTSAADRFVYRRDDLSSGSACVWGATIARMSAANRGSFAALSAARREVLQASDPVVALVESLLDGLTPPAEASFGLAGVAAAQFGGDLGQERAALVSGEPSGPGTDQGIEAFDGVSHQGCPPGPRDGDRLIESLASSGRAG